ncbi:50S ribosomal protein L6 [bacterium]|nr:50S ribosomal protein L6 [bacterium]
MSRIGKQPIQVPKGVTVNVAGNVFSAKSSKGELKVPFSQRMTVTVDGDTVSVATDGTDKDTKALWGLTRALINNAVVGVNEGWSKVLELRGVGYRAQVKGKTLDLNIGQSHPLEIEPPAGVTFEAAQENIDGENVQVIKVNGIDKQAVGDVAAKIRDCKPPEPYKGKGIRYRGEYVRRKAGKATG